MLDHKHILVSGTVKNPIKDEEILKDWFKRLVKNVDMKIVTGPHVKYVPTPGNEGLTGACCIETSHCSIHIWDSVEPPMIKFDLYSCKCFKPETVLEMLGEMDPIQLHWTLIDRNNLYEVNKLDEGHVIGNIDQVVS